MALETFSSGPQLPVVACKAFLKKRYPIDFSSGGGGSFTISNRWFSAFLKKKVLKILSAFLKKKSSKIFSSFYAENMLKPILCQKIQ